MVNDCRYRLFPSENCLDYESSPICDIQLILRANFHTSRWCQCLNSDVIVPSPGSNDWTLGNGGNHLVDMPFSLINHYLSVDARKIHVNALFLKKSRLAQTSVN